MNEVGHACTENPRHGLTLIELMASLVLMGVLLTAILGLVPRFAGRAVDPQFLGGVAELHWTRLALERLANDLVNARSGLIRDDSLELTGRLGRDPNTGWMNDREDTCDYRFVRSEEHHLLIRNQQGASELLGAGQVFLVIESADQTASGQPVVHLPGTGTGFLSKPLELVPSMRLSLQNSAGSVLGSILVVREPVSGSSLQSLHAVP